MTFLGRVARIGAVVLLAACASTGGGGAATAGDRSVLSAEELRAEPGRSLFEVIRQRRPQWLARRGASSLQGADDDVAVYQDGVRVGGPSVLANLQVTVVESVRFLSAAEATTRYGTGHPHGAILVVTRRQ